MDMNTPNAVILVNGDTGEQSVMAECYVHRGVFIASVEGGGVYTVVVDPETGNPPDVSTGPDGGYVHIEPSQDVMARCIQRFVCPDCAAAVENRKRERGLI